MVPRHRLERDEAGIALLPDVEDADDARVLELRRRAHIGDEIDVSYTRMFADGKVALQTTYGTIFSGGYLTSTLNQTQNQHWAYVSLWMNF